MCVLVFVFFNDTATTEIYTLSLHDALPIWASDLSRVCSSGPATMWSRPSAGRTAFDTARPHNSAGSSGSRMLRRPGRSEEHTSELQSRQYLVCRLLLEKKKKHSRLTFTV